MIRTPMKRIIPVMLISGMLCALPGCFGNTSSTSVEQSAESSTATDTSSSAPEQADSQESGESSAATDTDSSAPEQAASQESAESPTVAGIAAQFETPDGDAPDLSNADVDTNLNISELTSGNWHYVICHDSVYLAVPLGISYNSAGDTVHYDETTDSFADVPETVTHEYKRYNTGDVIGGLTLKECRTTFSSYLGGSTPRYFSGGEALFDGEITMSGVCCVVTETEGYDYQGDIYFIPDSESRFPVMNYTWNEDGTEIIIHGGKKGVSWCSEYQIPLNIGNISEQTDIDLSVLPTDGTYVPVTITVNNVRLRNDFNMSRNFSADLIKLEIR